MDNELPLRKKLRTESEDPIWTQSNTEKLEPNSIIPYTDMLDPNRAKLRTDIDDPRLKKSNTERVEPKRDSP
jgi:hypothetical protein